MKNNFGKYKDVLKGRDLELVETIAWENMHYFGYIPETLGNFKSHNSILYKTSNAIRDKYIELKFSKLREKNMAAVLSRNALLKTIIEKRKKEI